MEADDLLVGNLKGATERRRRRNEMATNIYVAILDIFIVMNDCFGFFIFCFFCPATDLSLRDVEFIQICDTKGANFFKQ